MTADTMPRQKVHHGRNVKRLRDILGIKQEVLALELNLTQQTVSNLEAKEVIDDETLSKIATVLKVPVESIKNFDEQATMNIIANTFTSHDTSTLNAINHYCTFNPIDKIVELYDDKIKLYELLFAERDKNNIGLKILGFYRYFWIF